MTRRLKPLSALERGGVVRLLDEAIERMGVVANTIGPAYGAAWCDKGLKVIRAVEKLRRQVIDKGYRP